MNHKAPGHLSTDASLASYAPPSIIRSVTHLFCRPRRGHLSLVAVAIVILISITTFRAAEVVFFLTERQTEFLMMRPCLMGILRLKDLAEEGKIYMCLRHVMINALIFLLNPPSSGFSIHGALPKSRCKTEWI